MLIVFVSASNIKHAGENSTSFKVCRLIKDMAERRAYYAPIPAKLSMLLEKIEQLAFLKRFHNEAYRSPLYGIHIPVAGI